MEETETNEIILYQPDETLTLDVRVEDETVWLTQAQMVSMGIRAHVSKKSIDDAFDACETIVKQFLRRT